MIRFSACILFILGLLLTTPISATANKLITLSVPDSVLSQALDKSLPIAIDTDSSTLSGDRKSVV